MPDVDQSLINEALDALSVTDIGPIGASGGQKAVRHVKKDNTDFVMKVVSLSASSPEILRRAEREVELLASLGSPHVVSVMSQLIELGTPTIGAAWLEEYLNGVDLTEMLFKEEWQWTDVAKLGYEVASGLAVAHANGVIHRDLSSNNIRCLADGTYKVLDFGFAHHTLRSGITFAGQPGTPGFMTPEHLNSYSGIPMPASDVFATGILMYAALTTKLPFSYTGNDAAYIQQLSTCTMVDIGSIRPDIKEDHKLLVRRCLHRQPARRFRNGAHLANALKGLR